MIKFCCDSLFTVYYVVPSKCQYLGKSNLQRSFTPLGVKPLISEVLSPKPIIFPKHKLANSVASRKPEIPQHFHVNDDFLFVAWGFVARRTFFAPRENHRSPNDASSDFETPSWAVRTGLSHKTMETCQNIGAKIC